MRARFTGAARARSAPLHRLVRMEEKSAGLHPGRRQAWPLGVALPGRDAQAVLTAPGRAAQECACLRLLEDDGAGRQALEVEQTVEFAFLHMHKTLRTRLAVTLVRRRPPPAPRTPLTAPGRCCTSLLVRGHACGAASLPAPRARAARVATKMRACGKVQARHRALWGDSVRCLVADCAPLRVPWRRTALPGAWPSAWRRRACCAALRAAGGCCRPPPAAASCSLSRRRARPAGQRQKRDL